MATEVWLTVIGEQTDSDGRSDRNATQCRALYEKKDGAHVFTYSERDPESGAVTDSEMTFSDNFGSIVRRGAIDTKMCFVPGQDYECVYDMAFGTILLKINTRLLAMKEVGANFHGRISYSLSFQGAEPMECTVTVKAEPVEGRA